MVVLPRGCPFPPEGTGDVFKFTEHHARPASQRSEASSSSPGRRTKGTLRRSGIAGSSWDTSKQGGNHLAMDWEHSRFTPRTRGLPERIDPKHECYEDEAWQGFS